MHWTVGAPFAGGAVLGLLVARQFASRLAGPRLQQLFATVGICSAVLLVVKTLST
ncbi:hypothetical protein D3C72_2356660 [compost metagenome]